MNASKPTDSSAPRRPVSGTQPTALVREQAEVIRRLVDDVETAADPELALAEELTRLGCRCVELAVRLRALIDARPRKPCA